MAGLLDRVYKSLPVPMQHVAVSAFGLRWNRVRFGGSFQKEVQAFRERERWSKDEWQRYQEYQLRKLLSTALTRVPYYQAAWKNVLTARQIDTFTLSDLQLLPVLEKSTVRDNPQSLLVDGVRQKRQMIQYTSGSSGTPVAAYWMPEELQRSLALRETRSCGFAKVSYRQPRGTFSGRIVVPDPNSKGPFHRYNLVEKQVYFSAFHLGPHSVEQYIRALRTYGTVWLTGYANSIYQLAQLADDAGIRAPQLKAVITTSEKLTSEMREVIARVFQTQVYEEYGTVEDCFYVCENEFGEKLINPDAGILEVVDAHFRPVAPETEGEVLATGFIRPNQPFIRYRIGDMAALSGRSPSCGRSMPVLSEVVGRVEDTIYGADGRRMVRFHGIFVDQPHVREGQIIQETLHQIRVRVVPKDGFGAEDEQDIRARIQQRLTDAVEVSIERVDHIERTKAGKFKAVISNLSAEEKAQLRTG